MEQQPPSLKLSILQGPRQGETLEYPPSSSSSVRIGRIARGNTLPIKDPGISSKHLSITIDSGKWVLQDLDSSNGTVLDTIKIPPNTPFPLSDNSTIKIGELTSIHVTLIPPQQQQQPVIVNNNNTRRNPTRRGRPAPADVADPTEIKPVHVPVTRQLRGRPATGKGLNTESGLAGQPENKRVTRNAKTKKVTVVEIPDSGGDDDHNDDDDDDYVEEKVEEVPKKTTRATRNSKKEGISDLGIGNSKVEEPKKATTLNLGNKGIGSVVGENDQNLNLESGVVEKVEEKKKRGRCAKKKKNLKEQECVKVAELEESKVDDEVVELLNLDEDGVVKETRDDVDERKGEEENVNVNGNGNWPDMEKMSLGEWFDFLEVQLPKQIIDATEDMIDSMRHKADRLSEYIIEQNNNDKAWKAPLDCGIKANTDAATKSDTGTGFGVIFPDSEGQALAACTHFTADRVQPHFAEAMSLR
ncbi:hypothetical protein RIF29_19528 [Crotalaria pallida]|uniref:FHA domain-containing protein n=1 Tax=Crotalaria pallida TaxID=3830 RepID=A0AAN9F1X1_CROPI